MRGKIVEISDDVELLTHIDGPSSYPMVQNKAHMCQLVTTSIKTICREIDLRKVKRIQVNLM